eukprot:6321836-Amphidinium_carterae.1
MPLTVVKNSKGATFAHYDRTEACRVRCANLLKGVLRKELAARNAEMHPAKTIVSTSVFLYLNTLISNGVIIQKAGTTLLRTMARHAQALEDSRAHTAVQLNALIAALELGTPPLSLIAAWSRIVVDGAFRLLSSKGMPDVEKLTVGGVDPLHARQE